MCIVNQSTSITTENMRILLYDLQILKDIAERMCNHHNNLLFNMIKAVTLKFEILEESTYKINAIHGFYTSNQAFSQFGN